MFGNILRSKLYIWYNNSKDNSNRGMTFRVQVLGKTICKWKGFRLNSCFVVVTHYAKALIRMDSHEHSKIFSVLIIYRMIPVVYVFSHLHFHALPTLLSNGMSNCNSKLERYWPKLSSFSIFVVLLLLTNDVQSTLPKAFRG